MAIIHKLQKIKHAQDYKRWIDNEDNFIDLKLSTLSNFACIKEFIEGYEFLLKLYPEDITLIKYKNDYESALEVQPFGVTKNLAIQYLKVYRQILIAMWSYI